MQVQLITLFPEMFKALEVGILGRAQKKGLLQLNYFNPRDFTLDKHRTVDDRPYGGGPGMVMKIEPLQAAIKAAKTNIPFDVPVSCLSAQGQLFNQAIARQLSQRNYLVLVSGRYEGIDERLIELEIDEEWSIGDFIMTGGELAAMCMIDAVTRLIPGVLGDDESAQQDSFSQYLLDHPHYTRPKKFNGLCVPEILLQGNHAAIRAWRLKNALGRTWKRRPDLLKKHVLDREEQLLLANFFHLDTKIL